MGPCFAWILHRGDAVGLGIEVIPSTPFPNDSSIDGHLDQIVCIHCAVVLGGRSSAFDFRYQLLRQLSQADQHYVAVSKSNTVVVVVGMAYLPENSTIPIRFENNTAFPRLLADKAIRMFDDFSVVKVSASVRKIAVVARSVGHLPSVNDIAIEVDKINLAAAALRCEQRQARKRSLMIVRPHSNPSPFCLDLFYRRHRKSPSIP